MATAVLEGQVLTSTSVKRKLWNPQDWREVLLSVPTMETIVTAKGKMRLFLQFEDFHGWDLHAAWDNLNFGLKHYSDFERIAMVGDRKREEWMTIFCKPFANATVKYFEMLEVDAAWKWLQEGQECNREPDQTDRPGCLRQTRHVRSLPVAITAQ